MRKEAIEVIHKLMGENQDVVFLTADLGYFILDSIKNDYPDRFFNMGAAEQLMLGAAVGMSLAGKIPICYSITPFLLYRPFEFIRNYLSNEQIPIKLIGSGRGRDYSHDGFSHWSEEDEDIIGHLKIKQFRPNSPDELLTLPSLILSNEPVYINLSRTFK